MIPDIRATVEEIATWLVEVRNFDLSISLLRDLQSVGVRIAVKARRKRERLFQDGVQAVFEKYKADLIRAALDGVITPAEVAGLRGALQTEIYLQLVAAAKERARELAEDLALGVDNDAVIGLLEGWARRKAEEVAAGIAHTTQDRLESLYRLQIDAGEPLTAEQIAASIDYTFGDARAETIAATELTGARSFALSVYEDKLNEMGIEADTRWLTAEDELVCPICGPLDHTLEEWETEFPAGPPAHPNCRCQLVLERPREIQL